MAVKLMQRGEAVKWIPLQVVQSHFPGVTESEANFLLWECTAYPCSGTEGADEELRALAERVRPRKRGWWRRLSRYKAACDADMYRFADGLPEVSEASCAAADPLSAEGKP